MKHNTMKTIRLMFTIGVLFTLSPSISAQQIFSPGYIILPGQDSTKGWIAELPASKRKIICLFQATQGSVVDSFPPLSLDGYGFEGGPDYESLLIRQKGIDSVTYYMERIVEGEANLYWYRDEVDSHFYLKSDKISGRLMRGGEETIVTPQRVIKRKILDYKQLLIQLTSEHEQIAEEPKRVGLNRKDLTKFINDWNTRTQEGAQQSSMEKVRQPLTYALGPVVQIGPYNYGGDPVNNSLRVGAVLNLSKPYSFNNLRIQIIPMFRIVEFGQEQELTPFIHPQDSSIIIQGTTLSSSYQQLSIRISVGKYWQFHRLSPYFLLGTEPTLFYETTSRYKSTEVERTTGTTLSSTVIPKTRSYFLPISFLGDLSFTSGAALHLSPRIDINAQVTVNLFEMVARRENSGLSFLHMMVMVPIRLGKL